ncbi:Stk1 family PASTA domain-containing Ser/Thr kinase [Metabacillus arenae]|uniref:Serine/threonine-protein kinase PrkC n=1 Tax=Metabacillus arenae TaxID=2771434 RepID=A0A926S0G9_9BACI|nr:Stk1 family PASTA domain-containing Ser/Thr kinase [Metabacillus arenae]MBD1379999.1 Stk1 family PASTA domain-containing Ser/Thr kinase [Metabacillus arenae]
MLVGKRLHGRYKIQEVIGGGGMANVYLARDVILEREVAVKVLRFDFANDEEFIRRFRREAQSATSLAHPNIVSIYDVGEEEDIYYIVMEYVEGQTLKQYIQQNAPLHPREALNIIEQIVSAIAHAHENQIVHRDIKPHNILIDHHGNVKVTDFGIAMALSSTTITQTNSVLGSVHYLSPEQARGGLATKKSDIYAIGIVLFELLTGRLPFDGESAISIALKHLQSDTPSPKRWNAMIPQSVENIILKAMAKDPFHRYETAENMLEDIETAFNTNRLNEQKFVIPDDLDATKAIPIITDDKISNGDDTLVHGPGPPPETPTAIPSKKQKVKKKKDKPKKKRSRFAKFIIAAFIILILAGVAAVTIVPAIFLPKDVMVPDLQGENYQAAYNQLTELGFKVDDETTLVEDEEIEEGLVVKTNPNAGKMAKEGSTITIYESSGKKKVTLNDYVGQDIEQVKELLERRGFEKITIEEVHSEEGEGVIVNQEPLDGEAVIPSEDEITLTYSVGPAKISLRDLSGYSKDAVDAYIEENGFKLNEGEAQYSSEVPAGQVISQSPNPGEQLDPGSTIEVVYSLGVEEKPVKTVTKEIEIPYEPAEEGEEIEVILSVDDAEHSVSTPYEQFKITEPTTRTVEFNIAPDSTAYYQVMIKDTIVKRETIPYPEDG